MIDNLTAQVFKGQGSSYGPGIFHEVVLALAEALSWLENQGIIVRNPTQARTVVSSDTARAST